ncbi:MAG TPA: nuclear transport factor 2 family protein [Candidatus Dormibacteraeota bacterium]|nr:nuclear transport factor 2 family protein [Candidatus Dormibacteraeota bacterium]
MADARTKLTPQQKIDLARKAYEEVNRGNAQAGNYAPDAVWHSVIWGDIRGADAIRATLQKQREALDDLKLEPHAILADDDHVVALLNMTMRLKGQTIQEKLVQVAHINDQGQIVELWGTGGDPAQLKKLLGG